MCDPDRGNLVDVGALSPDPSQDASAIVEALLAEYGDQAIIGAKAAFQKAGRNGDPDSIALLAEVCALLATRTH